MEHAILHNKKLTTDISHTVSYTLVSMYKKLVVVSGLSYLQYFGTVGWAKGLSNL